jgi:molybdopterin/thiamine biosynthesis adenylyltransferase
MAKKKAKSDFKILEEGSIDDDKYDRQKRIAGWDQSKVANATVMVIGVGATGNEVVKNLALTGIGKIIIVDYDIIEKSNLNRCVLFNMEEGIEDKYKVDVVKAASETLNSETEIIALNQNLNDIDKEYYKKSDVICSCLDNVEARLQANNYAYYNGTPFIDSGIEEFYGTVQAIYSGVDEAACMQCGISAADLDLMWAKFSCTGQEIKSEDGATVGKIATIITTTAIIGGLQSQQVLKFVLGIDSFKEDGEWNPKLGEPLIGKQLNYNGRTGKFDIIEKLKNPKCWTCSYKKK